MGVSAMMEKEEGGVDVKAKRTNLSGSLLDDLELLELLDSGLECLVLGFGFSLDDLRHFSVVLS